MLVRASKSFVDIWSYVESHPNLARRRHPLKGILPSPTILLSYLLSYIITTISEVCCPIDFCDGIVSLVLKILHAQLTVLLFTWFQRTFFPAVIWEWQQVLAHVSIGTFCLTMVLLHLYFAVSVDYATETHSKQREAVVESKLRQASRSRFFFFFLRLFQLD